MALSSSEINQVGYRLGYTSPFLIQQKVAPAAANLESVGEGIVRQLLADLTQIEAAIRENYSQPAAITGAASAQLQPFGQLNLLLAEAQALTVQLSVQMGLAVLYSRFIPRTWPI